MLSLMRCANASSTRMRLVIDAVREFYGTSHHSIETGCGGELEVSLGW